MFCCLNFSFNCCTLELDLSVYKTLCLFWILVLITAYKIYFSTFQNAILDRKCIPQKVMFGCQFSYIFSFPCFLSGALETSATLPFLLY